MQAAISAIYFAIGFLGFLSFWRWIAKDKPGQTGETFLGIMILLIWPVVLLCLFIVGFYELTVKIAEKTQKVSRHEETNVRN